MRNAMVILLAGCTIYWLTCFQQIFDEDVPGQELREHELEDINEIPYYGYPEEDLKLQYEETDDYYNS